MPWALGLGRTEGEAETVGFGALTDGPAVVADSEGAPASGEGCGAELAIAPHARKNDAIDVTIHFVRVDVSGLRHSRMKPGTRQSRKPTMTAGQE